MPRSVEEAKILIVGAGGIGCELLKNVVISGFKIIHVVDMDTIELSNLNRQFLFRRQHIGHSKAIVAREAALKLAPTSEITAHFDNIMDTSKFSIEFFAQFDLVLDALDNLAARRYVNNMCLAVNVPLVESGTAGYLGQTSIIINRASECFDCVPKEPPKTFPVCTIRSTPSSPIHCIIWAKEFLFPNLFGTESFNSPSTINGENDDELKETWQNEEQAFGALRSLTSDSEFFRQMSKKLFIDDIRKVLNISELWKNRVAPVAFTEESFRFTEAFSEEACDDQAVWPIEVWISLLQSASMRLHRRTYQATNVTLQHFDKDDLDALDFVAAASNLRAQIFSIPLTSRFQVKAMAGNIIPAIATTNAIAAAMMVVHATNILKERRENFCNAYINYGGARKAAFATEQLCPPSPDCTTCSVDRAILKVNCDTFTIKDVVSTAIPRYCKELGSKFGLGTVEIDEEDISILEGSRLLYDIDDSGNLSKSLHSINVGDSKFLRIDFYKRRPLLIGVINASSLSTSDLVFDLIEPKTEAKEASTMEDDSTVSDEDLIEIDAKRAKLG